MERVSILACLRSGRKERGHRVRIVWRGGAGNNRPRAGVQTGPAAEAGPAVSAGRPSGGARVFYVVPHGVGFQPVEFGSFLKSDVVMYGRVR